MELTLTVAAPGRSPAAVLVEAEADTTAGELAAALARELAAGRTGDGWLYVGGQPIKPAQTIDEIGLTHGAVVGLGLPASEPPADRGPFELAVVGGPAAGRSTAVTEGQAVAVGRSADNGLVVDDEQVSRRHAVVHVTAHGASVSDAGSRNGVGWKGHRIAGPQPLVPGDVFQVGDSVIAFREQVPPATVLDPPSPDWTRRFNRPPRIQAPRAEHEVTVPDEPTAPKTRRFPLLSMLAPLAIGIPLAIFLSPIYAVFIVLSPVMAATNYISDRRSGARDHRAKLAEYQQATADMHQAVVSTVAADELSRRDELPDPAAVVDVAVAPTARLWERRLDDPDFLELRVGLADRPARLRFRGDNPPEQPMARLVPVSFSLAEAGVAGLAGPREAAISWARSMLCQVAALHSPRDVGVVVLTGQDDAADWEWALWLPHLVPTDPSWGCRRLVGAGRQQVQERLNQLRRLVDERLEVAHSQLLGEPPKARRIVVVLDGARRLRQLDGVSDLLRHGPEAGVLALCVDAHDDSLPEECRATVSAMGDLAGRVTVRRAGSEPVGGVLPDATTVADACRLARALAPLRDATRAVGSGEIPSSLRLLELLGVDPPTADDVIRSWEASPGGHDTRAVLGMSATGPFSVDLRTDGPHGLVAGTTGAGKSELLQSLVASLALRNRPEALSFVLVDYKGGSAFKDGKDLPHCVGFVTDLDGHLAARALASLTAELKRRETRLAAAGAKDLEDYWAAQPPGSEPLPRLVIVVDEFATLVEEVPEFVAGVVGIGMRGRSLGVHVVLATQRPAGVVSADMRANVNLRISLRVANAQESQDVIEVPDAARIARDTPGRAYARTGYGELTLFQAGRVGGSPPAGRQAVSRPPVTAEPLCLAAMGSKPVSDGGPVPAETAAGPTDLGLLVASIREAAARVAARPGRSPWLAPLPELIPLEAVPVAAPGDGPARPGEGLRVTIGVVDVPEAQAQQPFTLDLAQCGSLLIVGTVHSGRSSALRTIAARLCQTAGPDDLHLYGIDFGNRALDPLAALPQCGAVVRGDDPDRLERLLTVLTSLVRQRTRAGTAEPPVVVLVDRLEAFQTSYAERDGGRLLDVFDRLLRDGRAVGLHFVMSLDRTGFTTRLASAVEARLALRQADRGDYALLGLDARTAPSHLPTGRALWVKTGHEVQIGLLGGDGSEQAQLDALEALATEARERWPAPARDRRPRRVEPLPEHVTLDSLATAASGTAPTGSAVVTIGAGGDELDAVTVDLTDVGPGFVVAGPSRSGRSTALVTIVRSLTGRQSGERAVVLVTPRPSPLRRLAGLPGVIASLGAGGDLGAELREVTEQLAGPAALVVDDAELVGDSAARVLEGVVRGARDRDLVVVAAATVEDLLLSRYRGWLADARRSRSGLLLTPQSSADGDVFDLRLSRSIAGDGWPPGRGLLVVRGRGEPVQVAVSR